MELLNINIKENVIVEYVNEDRTFIAVNPEWFKNHVWIGVESI